ncbi:hypothetical protein V8F33_013668 [Rhypophila sp. PSN 637]
MNTVEEIAASLSAEQKQQLEEVAKLMLEIFRTLQRMAYLEDEWIQPGPHNDAINALMPLYQSLDIDPAIIYLYSILPCIDPIAHRRVDFFDGGTFVDFRDKNHVTDGRDPFYTYTEEMKVPPWMTLLSQTGNETKMLFYDAKRHRVGIFNGVCGGISDGLSGDLNIDVGRCISETQENGSTRWYKKARDGAREDIETEEEFRRLQEEWWARRRAESEGQEGEYRYNFEEMMVNESRPAPDVLRDINRWYIELVNVPGAGGSNSGEHWNAEWVVPLYRKHGWPGEDFDREAFLVDHLRANCLERAKYLAEEPLRQVRREPANNRPLQEALMAKVETAKAAGDIDEEWALRWEMWWNEHQYQEQKAWYERTKETAERLCPNGECIKPAELPLWELREVQIQMYDEQRRLRELQSDGPSIRFFRYSTPEREEEIRCQEIKVALLEKAIAASEADVARLCPDKTPFLLDIGSASGVRANFERVTYSIDGARKTQTAIREWMGQLPEGAERARNLAKDLLDKSQQNVNKLSEMRDRSKRQLEKWEKLEVKSD